MKKDFQKIFTVVFIAVYGVYGIIASIFQFMRGTKGLIDGFAVIVCGGVLCSILYLSCFHKWGRLSSFFKGIFKTGKPYRDKEVDKSGWYSESEEFKEKMREQRKKELKEWKFKFNTACIGPCLVCLLGTAIFFTVAGFELSKIYGGIYVKAQATIINYVSNDGQKTLVFELVENGKTYLTAGADSWAGVGFVAGNTVTVYHPALHPEVIWQPSTAIMLCAGGMLFFGIGVVVFMTINDLTSYVGIPCGLVFAGICVAFDVAVAVAGGFGFFQLLVSGALAYASFGFICLGIFFIGIGCVNVYRRFTGDEML